MTGGRSVQADSSQPQPGQQVDRADAAATTHPASQTPALTPIRRGSDPQNAPGGRARPSSLASTLALLGLVLGGAYLALKMLRLRQKVGSAPTQAIDVLASRRLDGQSTLHLVRIGRRVLAVGSSAAGTRTLAVIEDVEEVAQLLSTSGHGGRDAGSPSNWSAGLAEPGGRGPRQAERRWTTGLFAGFAGASPSPNAGSQGSLPPPDSLGGTRGPA